MRLLSRCDSSFIIGDGPVSAFFIATIRWRRTASLNLNACSSSVERRLVALDVHQDVVRLVHLLDRIGQLAAAPVLEAVDLAAVAVVIVRVALDHRGHLLALIGMHDKYDFVMTHIHSLC